MKRTLSLVLVFLMAFGFIGNIPIVADAAAPTSYTNINITAAGGTNYSLFNSGRTGIGTNTTGKLYSDARNPSPTTYTNSGYDVYVRANRNTYNCSSESQIGLSFVVNVDVDEKSQLTIYAYDVDEESGEVDGIYLVNETTGVETRLGALSGMNEGWYNTSLEIPSELLLCGSTYHIKVKGEDDTWCVYVRSVNLIVNGSEPVPTPVTGIESADLSASISSSGLVSVDLTANAYAEENYTLEYKAVCSADQSQRGGKEYSVTIPTSSETFSTAFQLESGAPRGTYRITVFIKDVDGNVVAMRYADVSYGYSAVSYNSNGGSQNLPADGTTYSSGDTVTVLFNYIPSMYGYTFLGWSANRNATEPTYTENGAKTFTIGASDVTLYAVWALEHATCVPGDWIIDQNPTCTEPGSKHTECTGCGKTLQEEMIPAPGHDYVYTRTQEPTCTAEGYDLYTCNRSGCDSTKKQMIDKLPHDYGDDNVCDNCGHTIPVAHTHSYISVIVPPTCSTMGYTEHTCDCGHSYRNDYIENLSHNWIETVTREKTCTTDGLKTYSCTNCDATFTEIIPAGHNWQDTVTQPATCTTDGQISRTCLDCGATEVETVPAGHTWNAGAQIQAPTCTEAGLMRHTCVACGHEETAPVDPLGHNYVNGVCTRCGASFIDNVTSDSDHPEYGMYFEVDDIKSGYGPDLINEYGVLLDYNPDAQLKKVGVYLTQDGTMWRRCIAVVGDNITYATYVPYLSYDEDIKYTGLNSAWINTFRLSENSDGIWCYSNYATIGVNLEDAYGNLLLSLYDIGQAGAKTRIFDDLNEMIEWFNEPSDCISHTKGAMAYDDDSHWYECAVCFAVMDTKAPHSYDNNCDADCNVCGATRTVIHDYSPATCTTPATCSVCGDTEGTYLGHRGGEATCKSAAVCELCSEEYGSIDINNHKTLTVLEYVAPTCTATGLTEGAKCSSCGVVTTEQNVIEVQKHSYADEITPATLTKDGSIESKCTVCEDVESFEIIPRPEAISLSTAVCTYNGKVRTPSVIITDTAGNSLVNNTDYTVNYESGRILPGRYVINVTFKGHYSGSENLIFTIKPKAPTKISATQSASVVKLTWQESAGATGYRVYQYSPSKDKYVLKASVKGVTSYRVTNLKAGTEYSFKIKPYTKLSDGAVLWGTASAAFKTATEPAVPTLTVKASSVKGRAAAEWTDVSGETGYQLYYSTKKTSDFTKVKSYGENVLKGTKSSLESGKTYYFKVRAYKKVNGQTIFGEWSAVKSVKIK